MRNPFDTAKSFIENIDADEIKSNAKHKVKAVKSMATDAYYAVYRKASAASSTTKAATSRAIRGFDFVECWNFGWCTLLRSADICRYLLDADYDTELPKEYRDMLSECELVFRSYYALGDSYFEYVPTESTWVEKDSGADVRRELLTRMADEMTQRVMPCWEWYGNNILNVDKFIVPSEPDTIELMKERATSIAAGEISFDDVKNLPASECERMKKILRHLAGHLVGYEEGYAKSDKMLKEHEEGWEKRQIPFTVAFLSEDAEEFHKATENPNVSTLKTREEIGLDYCAWMEDIAEAATLFRKYAEWNSPVEDAHDRKRRILDIADIDDCQGACANKIVVMRDITMREYAKTLFDAETFALIDADITAQKDRAWMWVGKMIPSLWD